MDVKRGTMLVLAVLGVLLLAGGVWVFYLSNSGQPATSPPAQQPAHSSPAQYPANETAEAAEVAAALTALTDDPSAGVAAAAQESFEASVALPPGSKLTPEPSSWAPDNDGGGTMNVVLSIDGVLDSRYVAIMLEEDGHWKVLGTIEQSEEATP